MLHVPWSASRIRKGNTASSCYEQAYPQELCRRLLKICAAAHHLPLPRARPAGPIPDGEACNAKRVKAEAKVAGGQQPRGRALGPLVPEFKEVATLTGLFAEFKPWLNAGSFKLTSGRSLSGRSVPEGARLLGLRSAGNGDLGVAAFEIDTKTKLTKLREAEISDDLAVEA